VNVVVGVINPVRAASTTELSVDGDVTRKLFPEGSSVNSGGGPAATAKAASYAAAIFNAATCNAESLALAIAAFALNAATALL
jgi:hypothetical protein